jgi:predicted CXXCH cytochrome family protein
MDHKLTGTKTVITRTITLLMLIFSVNFSVAYAEISGSAHDFSRESWAEGQICLPCHTPHFATGDDDAPLWNHETTTATYTLYNRGSLDATTGQPRGVSKLCLSCHDGTVAIDSFGGRSGSIFIDSDFHLGSDLSDDHPISFIFDDALATEDGELFPPSSTPSGIPGSNGTIQTDMLVNDSLECSSCHDVHNANDFDELLVKSNDGSALCLTCHNK